MSAGVEVALLGIGLVGPGLPAWAEGQRVLRGELPYAPVPTLVPPPQRLPAAERRRAGVAVKVALTVADAACAQAGVDPAVLVTVFTSSSGDGANCHALCETLANPPGPERLVSPTRFTNSVHNASAGYWHIAVGSQQASTSVCAHDDSFGAGLLAALTQLPAQGAPVLLVASDAPYPEPLHAARPLPDCMGVAFVLASPAAAGTGPAQARLRIRLLPQSASGPVTPCREPALEQLRASIPAARALPLLEALARGEAAHIVLRASAKMALAIEVSSVA
ncbi:MAG TPA: beta-ketoacyl synthase chain length factor [Ramlibacter sp.]|nr:beta-ketoacyl synthase chain length factor [Ramlibacter sp.]